jgi:serine/threonine protein kinase
LGRPAQGRRVSPVPRGIVHRDLKPANVKIAKDGGVKILDFGVARTYEEDGPTPPSGVSQSPTMTRPLTEAGFVLCTAAYMSPEQARGKPVDRRADIWSFGVVLYEMLTGRRPFVADTVSDTLAAVLREDPQWNRLPAACPAGVGQLLRRCLEKDVRRRVQAIGEARIVLEDALAGPDSPAATVAPGGWSGRPTDRIVRGRSHRGGRVVGTLALVAAADRAHPRVGGRRRRCVADTWEGSGRRPVA